MTPIDPLRPIHRAITFRERSVGVALLNLSPVGSANLRDSVNLKMRKMGHFSSSTIVDWTTMVNCRGAPDVSTLGAP